MPAALVAVYISQCSMTGFLIYIYFSRPSPVRKNSEFVQP